MGDYLVHGKFGHENAIWIFQIVTIEERGPHGNFMFYQKKCLRPIEVTSEMCETHV